MASFTCFDAVVASPSGRSNPVELVYSATEAVLFSPCGQFGVDLHSLTRELLNESKMLLF
jgi:hypothetical protein